MAKEIKEPVVEVVDNQEGIPLPTTEDMTPSADDYKGWIKMSPEQMALAQEQEILIGYHPGKGLGLVKVKETKKK